MRNRILPPARRLPSLVAAAALVAFPASLAAQAPAEETAGLVTLLGNDTLAVEQWTRGAHRIVASAAVRTPRATLRRYVLEMAPDGTMRRYEERVFDPSAVEAGPVRVEMVEAAEGGWTRTLTVGDSTETARVEGPAAALPWVDLVHWPFEPVLERAARGGGRVQPLLASGRVMEYRVEPQAGGAWRLVHPFRGPSTARADARGRLLSLDAAETTRKVVVTRVAGVDVEGVAQRWGAEERAGRGMGDLSGRGREEAEVAGARIEVDYGTPQKRGRDIFGTVVRWGELWRTGANRATHLTTDRTLVLEGGPGETLVVPPGEYTLFSIPEEQGGVLIVNRQTGQNGNRYDAAQDLGRVSMRRGMLDAPVETFTIRARPAGEGRGELVLAWDTSEFVVPFTVR